MSATVRGLHFRPRASSKDHLNREILWRHPLFSHAPAAIEHLGIGSFHPNEI